MIIFKFPFQEKIYTSLEDSTENGVSFFSFDEKNQIHFKGNLQEITSEVLLEKPIFTSALDESSSEILTENKASYTEKLSKVIHFIKENNLSKLVISRRKVLNYSNFNKSKTINLSQTFLNLAQTYPNAFVYFFIKDKKCWMGAFSEVLGKFDKKTNQFHTMSLAGTLPVDEEWSEKEIEEQKPVSDYISGILKKYSEQIEKSETYNHLSGNIKHLRTDFKAKIKAQNLEQLISDLHPTPAVCGIPKEFCKQAIQNFEQESREFYSGYIKTETPELIQYFVNLRCAKFSKNNAIIYVGGGITALSSPEKEWRETELKSEAILNNLA